jgi:LuxR family transcriptional regulator, regulator of acetate metabolism
VAATQEGFDRRAAARVVVELRRLERELVELEFVRRTDALEAARDAVSRLVDLGSPAAILDRAGAELGSRSRFEYVLLSRVAGGELAPRSLWIAGRDDTGPLLEELAAAQIAIEYPLVEAEVAQTRRGAIVAAAPRSSPAARRLAAALDLETYVVVPVLLHGATVGLLHGGAGRSAPAALDEVDLEVAELFADGLADAFERAVLRETLLHHRRSLQSAIQWIDGRLARVASDAPGGVGEAAPRDADAADPLTPREAEVIALMARGLTNLAIAKTLVVREGTVKYHVKNILRKLGASSRSDAVARYARSAMASTPPAP